jgi:aspartate/methionine/tyrosine aminotransferase
MVSGPVQAAATVALGDDTHVEAQRARYAERLGYLAEALRSVGIEASPPAGTFYLWVEAPDGMTRRDTTETAGWALSRWLADHGGVLTSPGELYGAAGSRYVRLAVVQPMSRLELVAKRLASAPPLA